MRKKVIWNFTNNKEIRQIFAGGDVIGGSQKILPDFIQRTPTPIMQQHQSVQHKSPSPANGLESLISN